MSRLSVVTLTFDDLIWGLSTALRAYTDSRKWIVSGHSRACIWLNTSFTGYLKFLSSFSTYTQVK